MADDKGWSVGMAVFDRSPDFYESTRAFYTAMSLLIHHPRVKEVVFVDNNPLAGNPLEILAGKTGGAVRYVPFPAPVGTAAPRNHVFKVAKYDRVAVCDPHVLLYPGAFEAFDQFYEKQGKDSLDLLHGPLMTENPGHYLATHMNRQWRSEMLGTWAWAWAGPKKGRLFSTMTRDDKTLEYVTMPRDTEEQRTLRDDEIAFLGLPKDLAWAGHEPVLFRMGFHPPTPDSFFPIPGHGMGFFACRKEAWLPFHEDCRGFGGEEITTGMRYREAGRRCWCVMGAKWLHDFGRQAGRVPYRLTAFDKMRNYVLEAGRTGDRMTLLEIRNHFNPPRREWDAAVQGVEWPAGIASADDVHREQLKSGGAMAVRHETEEQLAVKRSKSCGKPSTNFKGLDGFHNAAVMAASPLSQDLKHLKHLAATCGEGNTPGVVVEVVHQAVSGVSLMAGRPKKLVSFGPVASPRTETLKKLTPPGCVYEPVHSLPNGNGIPECDLLFLDVDPHTDSYYRKLLNDFTPKVKRYVALHDIDAYGEKWNDLPGLRPAVSSFLADHADWHEVMHHKTPAGLLILSRNADDGPNCIGADDEVQPGKGTGQNAGVYAEQQKIPDFGPGTELKEILASMGITEKSGCDCTAKLAQMNYWGVDGCRQNVNTIVGWLKDNSGKWGWKEKLSAAASKRGIIAGLKAILGNSDPYRELVIHAISRAEDKEGKS